MSISLEKEELDKIFTGAQVISKRIVDSLTNERGIHAPSFLCTLGALAGYACQYGVVKENKKLVVLGGKNGQEAYFGDDLNEKLLEGNYSVWAIVASVSSYLGDKDFYKKLDIIEIVKHSSQTLFTDEYFKFNVPSEHTPFRNVLDTLKIFWNSTKPMAENFCTPEKIYILFAFAAQMAIMQVRNVIDPLISMKIIMQSACVASHIKLD